MDIDVGHMPERPILLARLRKVLEKDAKLEDVFKMLTFFPGQRDADPRNDYDQLIEDVWDFLRSTDQRSQNKRIQNDYGRGWAKVSQTDRRSTTR